LPRMSLFSKDRPDKKKNVLQKIIDFFEKFINM
jgi:hypothetical protein